jgi:signal transduction histidine kinase
MSSIARLDPSFFERLFHGAGLAVFACDTTGRIQAGNSRGHELLRAVCASASNASVEDIVPAPDRAALQQSIRACVSHLDSVEFRSHLALPGREPTDYAVWISPVLTNDGALEGISVWFHDITERIRVRRHMRKHERLHSLGAMSGAVAHHYNNLLCSIATSLEYALNMNTMPAMRRALSRTSDAVLRATSLTQQLLAFAQGDHRILDEADLTETVLHFLDSSEAKFHEHDVTLTFDWQPIPVIAVPRDHVVIILRNLVENALDAMPNGGSLHLSLAVHDEHHVRITLVDSGPGIKPEQMEHLFEPFYTTRGELACGDERKAGMGLAVVYGLVSELHGTVAAANSPGGGARFDVVLPVNPRRGDQ